jgi:peptidoglycan/LPS O-acetylase OafA/YrhL
VVPSGKPSGFDGPVNNKFIFTFALSAMLLLLSYQARRPRWSATAASLMCFSLVVLAGCGSTSSPGGGGSTPVTTQTITVTGVSGAITHNATFTLIVE